MTLTPSELLTRDGRPNQKASGEPYRWTYTLRGGGEESWAPRFTYYGFRYVLVEGAVPAGADAPDDVPRVVSIEMAHTRNSAPEVGRFETSSALFDRIFALVRWAIRSNMASVLTDCPHREKLGWLEQTYLMGDAVHFNYDLLGLYRKQVADVIEAQTKDGLVPDIAPEYVEFDAGFRDSPEWGAAGVVVPWLVYRWYGDRETLERAWPTMKRYVDYLGTKADGHLLSHGLGDWFDLGPARPGEAQLTPKAVTATAIYFRCLRTVAAAARVLGHADDAARYDALAEDVRAAFNRAFYDTRVRDVVHRQPDGARDAARGRPRARRGRGTRARQPRPPDRGGRPRAHGRRHRLPLRRGGALARGPRRRALRDERARRRARLRLPAEEGGHRAHGVVGRARGGVEQPPHARPPHALVLLGPPRDRPGGELARATRRSC